MFRAPPSSANGISPAPGCGASCTAELPGDGRRVARSRAAAARGASACAGRALLVRGQYWPRSEEHTSELQSRQYLVCRLLLEKKKQRWIAKNGHDRKITQQDPTQPKMKYS